MEVGKASHPSPPAEKEKTNIWPQNRRRTQGLQRMQSRSISSEARAIRASFACRRLSGAIRRAFSRRQFPIHGAIR
jgi:hypothetical protein